MEPWPGSLPTTNAQVTPLPYEGGTRGAGKGGLISFKL